MGMTSAIETSSSKTWKIQSVLVMIEVKKVEPIAAISYLWTVGNFSTKLSKDTMLNSKPVASPKLTLERRVSETRISRLLCPEWQQTVNLALLKQKAIVVVSISLHRSANAATSKHTWMLQITSVRALFTTHRRLTNRGRPKDQKREHSSHPSQLNSLSCSEINLRFFEYLKRMHAFSEYLSFCVIL